MDERERRTMHQMLDRTRDEFLASLDGVTDAQARWRPAPDKWSVLDCTEHVAVSERGMLRLITEFATPLSEADPTGREDQIVAKTLDRTRPLSAPDLVHPRGRFATLADAADRFRSNRQATAAFVEGCELDLRRLETHHPLLGRMTANECLFLLATHPSRHAAQVRELHVQVGFPGPDA